jgi:hypothetical protein
VTSCETIVVRSIKNRNGEYRSNRSGSSNCPGQLTGDPIYLFFRPDGPGPGRRMPGAQVLQMGCFFWPSAIHSKKREIDWKSFFSMVSCGFPF